MSVERRRRWSREEKERLVAATLEPGTSVSEIAHLAGIHVIQLFRWRKELCQISAPCPSTAYRFEDSRAGECVARHLNGYRGILQVDGYAAYNKLVRSDRGNDGVILAGCWSHSRRKFCELHVAES